MFIQDQNKFQLFFSIFSFWTHFIIDLFFRSYIFNPIFYFRPFSILLFRLYTFDLTLSISFFGLNYAFLCGSRRVKVSAKCLSTNVSVESKHLQKWDMTYGQTDIRTNGQKNKRTQRQTDIRTNRRKDKQTWRQKFVVLLADKSFPR